MQRKTVENITYPHECASQIAEVLNLTDFVKLKISMNEEHLRLNYRPNRLPILEEYMLHTCKDEALRELLKSRLADQKARALVTELLNEPTFEAFRVLEKAGLPTSDHSVVFNTTATANSGNDNAVLAALKILGIDHAASNIVIENCSTCTHTGFTGVSYVKPKHTPVSFNPNTPLEEWEALSWDLAAQLYRISTGSNADEEDPVIHEKYTHIYHWGCISQNWLKNPLGHLVSSWKLHEKWNLLFTIAMMWHAVATLQTGGQLCIKVRIFRAAETLGLVSLLSPLFDTVHLLDNARQSCSFAVAVFGGLTSDLNLRREMLGILRSCMSFEPSAIYFNRIQREYTTCYDTMLEAQKVRDIMVRKRAQTDTVYLACLDCVKLYLQRNNKRVMYDTALPLLIDTYGPKFGEDLFHSFMLACKQLSPQQQNLFLAVMDTPWMHDNV
jgi:hypothetical protein